MASVPCGRSYMPLCSIPARAARDGFSGPNAKITLPFYGFFWFNGGTYNFPTNTAPQDPRIFNLGGGSQPDTFKKDCCTF